MYEMLIDFFVARPGRLSALGRAIFQLSAMILLVCLYGRIATAGVSAIQSIAGARPHETSLALLYPHCRPGGYPRVSSATQCAC